MSGQSFEKVPPGDGRGLVIGPKIADLGTVTREHGQIFGTPVRRQDEPRVSDQPQRRVRFLSALLQQLSPSRLTRQFAPLDTPAREFPVLAVPIENRENPAVPPEGNPCRRQGCVPRRHTLDSPGEGDQGIATVVDCKRLIPGTDHVPRLPSSPFGAHAPGMQCRPDLLLVTE